MICFSIASFPACCCAVAAWSKPARFKDAKYVGDPVNAIRIFNEKEVDELMVLDIVASKEGVDPDYRMIGQFAGECFMPLCYGGGIRTLDQAKRVFDLGVEKVCLQSAVLDRPAIVTEIAGQFGSQSVVVSVDVKRDWLRRPRLYQSCYRQDPEAGLAGLPAIRGGGGGRRGGAECGGSGRGDGRIRHRAHPASRGSGLRAR